MSKQIRLHLPAGRVRILKQQSRTTHQATIGGDTEATQATVHEGVVTQTEDATSVQRTIDEFEERLKSEYKAGFDEGRRHTEKHLRDDLTTKLANSQKQFETLTASLTKGYEKFQLSAERNVVRLALAIAERIVKREVVLDDELLVRQIHDATKRIVGVERIKIRVHPNDEELVRQHRVQILSSTDAVRELVFEGDETIERGGCIVESESGNVDALIATQLERIEDALFGGQVKR